MHWNLTWRTKRKWQWSHPERWSLALRTSPALTQLQLCRVGKEDGFPWGSQHRHCSALPSPEPTCQNPPGPIAEFAQCESNTSKQTFTMFFLLCTKDIPASHGPLKFSQDLFCPLLSINAWKIPSKACHKARGCFPCLLQDSWNVKFLRICCKITMFFPEL